LGAVAWSLIDQASMERRHHARVKVQLSGRFMRPDRQEFDCETIDMSPGGVAFASNGPVRTGDRIVAYIHQVGRIEGTVARNFPGGFAIQMKLPPAKRDRLADQLTWLANRASLGLPEDRRHERIAPNKPQTKLRLTGGREIAGRLLDISRSGAAIAVGKPVAVGESVIVGSTHAQVVRVFDGGVAVEFAGVIPAQDFSADVVL
jgi:PilZ domain